jgi:hypothetical protein
MMVRSPRQPIDFNATTARVLVSLEVIDQNKDPIFQDPRSVWLELTLGVHELEAALWIMKKAWWP